MDDEQTDFLGWDDFFGDLPQLGLEAGMQLAAERIDTWNMILEPLEEIFEIEKLGRYTYTDVKQRSIPMLGKPYMALRLRRAD